MARGEWVDKVKTLFYFVVHMYYTYIEKDLALKIREERDVSSTLLYTCVVEFRGEVLHVGLNLEWRCYMWCMASSCHCCCPFQFLFARKDFGCPAL